MGALRVLVVDDEPAVRRSLRAGLEAEGWFVAEAQDRATLFSALETGRFDAITLDLNLGRDNGLDLAREVRGRWNIPVLMLTGLGQPVDRVRGLEHGADDYIVKPVHIREVVLRIRNTLDRYRTTLRALATEVAFDHSRYDTRSGTVRHRDGSTIDLTGLERQLFELFSANPGRVFSRDDISRALHGREWSPLDRTIDGHVARLRRKLEPPGEAPTLIRSVRGVGYVFAGAITPARDPA